MIGQAFPPNLHIGPVFAPGMDQFNPIGVGDPQGRRLRQKGLGPGAMRRHQAKQARALGQRGEPGAVMLPEPAVARALPASLEGKQQADGDDLARGEVGIRVLGHIGHHAIDPQEQANATLLGSHATSPYVTRILVRWMVRVSASRRT